MLKGIVAFGLTRRAIVLLGLLVFVAAGLVAFSKLNIEAYPNPAPVILEITAQAAGLSAEEMERYYTIPMEVGLYITPGVDNIRSTSFYGLSFVRVTFKYGIDFYFAFTQAQLMLQQNVSLPGGQSPVIQQSSLVGEVLRYQIVGPPHFGLTNLRTVQDWIVTRRLFTVPGVVAVNSWGGTTKQYDVDVDLNKLDAYNVTLPQIISALGNANINVGGREITVGQQSVNIRGIGLMDSGGNSDLTQGWRVGDIENVVLAQVNGVPVQVKDVAKVSVGHVPRLGIAGKDHESDVALAIVVMGRVYHTNDVIPLIKAKIAQMNSDGTLPPGVKLVPYYDRSTLVSVTTHTVLHNLIFGCLLVFLIQWIFLGNLRSAIIVGVNIPFALFFAVIVMVLMGQDANLLSVGAVDFGIIVDFGGDPDREHFQEFSKSRRAAEPVAPTRGGSFRRRPDTIGGFDAFPALDRSAAAHPGQRPAGRHGDLVFRPDHGGRVRASFHHAGGRRSDLQPDGTDLRPGAIRRLGVDLYHHAGAGFVFVAAARRGNRDLRRPGSALGLHTGSALVACPPQSNGGDRRCFSGRRRLFADAARRRVPAGAGRRQSMDSGVNAADDRIAGRRTRGSQDARDSAPSSRSHHRRVSTRPAG